MKTLAIALIATFTALYLSLAAIDSMMEKTTKAQEDHKIELNQ